MEKIYGAPKKGKEFKKYWDLLLPQIKARDNFNENHLNQLEILCDLYLEYSTLTLFIKDNGYSFTTEGRYGMSSRPHVEVNFRSKVMAEIRAYTKLLDLVIDKAITDPEDPEDEWGETK